MVARLALSMMLMIFLCRFSIAEAKWELQAKREGLSDIQIKALQEQGFLVVDRNRLSMAEVYTARSTLPRLVTFDSAAEAVITVGHESGQLIRSLAQARVREFLLSVWRQHESPLFGAAVLRGGMLKKPPERRNVKKARMVLAQLGLEVESDPGPDGARAALEVLAKKRFKTGSPKDLEQLRLIGSLEWPEDALSLLWGGRLLALRSLRQIVGRNPLQDDLKEALDRIMGHEFSVIPPRHRKQSSAVRSHDEIMTSPVHLTQGLPSLHVKRPSKRDGLLGGFWQERFLSSYAALAARARSPLVDSGVVLGPELTPPPIVANTTEIALDPWPSAFAALHIYTQRAYATVRKYGGFGFEASRLRAIAAGEELGATLKMHPKLAQKAKIWPRSIPPRAQERLRAILAIMRRSGAPMRLGEAATSFIESASASELEDWVGNIITEIAIAHHEKWLVLLSLNGALRRTSDESSNGIVRVSGLGFSYGVVLSSLVRYEGPPFRGHRVRLRDDYHGFASPPLDFYVRQNGRLFIGSIRLYFKNADDRTDWPSKGLRPLDATPSMRLR